MIVLLLALVGANGNGPISFIQKGDMITFHEDVLIAAGSDQSQLKTFGDVSAILRVPKKEKRWIIDKKTELVVEACQPLSDGAKVVVVSLKWADEFIILELRGVTVDSPITELERYAKVQIKRDK